MPNDGCSHVVRSLAKNLVDDDVWDYANVIEVHEDKTNGAVAIHVEGETSSGGRVSARHRNVVDTITLYQVVVLVDRNIAIGKTDVEPWCTNACNITQWMRLRQYLAPRLTTWYCRYWCCTTERGSGKEEQSS